VLGSRSTDLLSGLGPLPLADGDRVPVGGGHGHGLSRSDDALPYPGPPYTGSEPELVLPLAPGPRDDWFAPRALKTLVTGAYTVAPASNRIGLRILGPALERTRGGELPSEGMVLGAVQVPPDGRPVVFLADHPTTRPPAAIP
jgi:allophanate hydrolase subunit 2